MAKQDYYATLGVAKNASADDLKKAYRKLAMQYHPDRNPGDKQAEARFKDVSEAYDILKDDQKRGAYDRFGHAAFEQGGGAARVRVWAGSISPPPATSATSSTRCSGWAGAAAVSAPAPAMICARASRSTCSRRSPAPRSICGFRRGSSAKAAKGPDRRTKGARRRPARPAKGAGKVRTAAGVLPDRADLPDMRRPGPGDPQSMPGLSGRRHGAA